MNPYASPHGTIVLKYGGNALPQSGEPDGVLTELAQLWQGGARLVLVHGGGPEIDRCLAERGIATARVDGMRLTDLPTLETTEAVLCGTLNKRLVRACTALGLPAVGISGQDGGTLVAERMAGRDGADLGFVGRITASDPRLINALLANRFLPVVAPLAVSTDARHAFNVNADLAAAALAGALRARAFVALTNVTRVLRDPDDPSSAIDRFSLGQARAFAASDACRSSMKPKLHAAIAAVESGVRAAYICAARPGAIAAALDRDDATVISNETQSA